MLSFDLNPSFNPLDRGNSNQIGEKHENNSSATWRRFNPLDRGNSNQMLTR